MSTANIVSYLPASPATALSRLAQKPAGFYTGSATLAAGTIAVTVPGLPKSAVIVVSPVGAGVAEANAGALSVSAVANPGAANAAFTIYSTEAADVRVVNWAVFLQA